jgi:hypothetical protein
MNEDIDYGPPKLITRKWNEDYIAPAGVRFGGKTQDVESYGLLDERWWFLPGALKCDACGDRFGSGLYALFTKTHALMPCQTCERVTSYNFEMLGNGGLC